MYRVTLPSKGGEALALNVVHRLQSTHSNMQIKAYCDLLGVPIHASEAKIKQEFYKKSMMYHPDRNPGNEGAAQLFGEINEAYQALMLNRREQAATPTRGFSDRKNFKSHTIRQWRTPTVKTQRTVSTSWEDVNSEERQKARERFSLNSREMSNTWYESFYKNLVADEFERHKQIRKKKESQKAAEGCVVM